MTNQDAAMQYACNGWPVFPLWPINAAGECSCPKGKECTVKPGKHPHISAWQTVVIDLVQVEKWWSNWPNAGIGMRLDYLTVLDADTHDADKNGFVTLATLEQKYGAVLEARVKQRTGGGGEHQLFKAVEDLKTAIGFAPGVDLLSDSGHYIVVEPTIHTSGNPYRWVDAVNPLTTSCADLALDEPPQWFLRAVSEPKQQSKTQGAKAKAAFVLPERIEHGVQHDTLVKFAGAMRRNGADEAVIFAALKEANKRCDKPGPEENLRNIARTVARYEPGGEGGKAGKGPNHADILLGMIGDFEYFKSGAANEAYVRMSIGDHRELWRVSDRDTKVREVLTHRFLVEHGRAPSREALNTAIDTIMAKCSMGLKVDVHVRFARGSDVIYLDLVDEQWRAVEITKDGWRVVDNPPVLFRRAAGARPLPVPIRGGSLDQLRPLLNSGDDSQWLLMLSWLVGVFLPEGAFVHLVLNGEQGSAKTSVALALVSVLDPSDAGLTSPPKDEVDATVSALHAGVLAYDNMSGCRADLSDVFCRFSTGQGYRVRTLYQNLGVTVASVKLPVIMNGISSTVMRGDLVERSIILKLPTIPPEQRLTEKGVVADFAAMHAGVLGALLDVVGTGLRNLPHTVLDRLPRMSDFALWISACEAALPWPAGRFLKTYFAKMKFANMDLVEGDTLASALVEWGERLAPGQNMQISTRELLTQLNDLTRGWPKDLKYWPASAEDLVHKLMRLAPVLRASDIDVRKLKRTGKMRSHWEISRTGPQIALVLPEAA